MKNEINFFEIVDNDPDFDYEFYDNYDFGDDMEEADRNGELFTIGELGCTNAYEAGLKLMAILDAKKKRKQEAEALVRFSEPASCPDFCLAEPEAAYPGAGATR